MGNGVIWVKRVLCMADKVDYLFRYKIRCILWQRYSPQVASLVRTSKLTQSQYSRVGTIQIFAYVIKRITEKWISWKYQLIKVRKSQKQFFLPTILAKNEEKNLPNSEIWDEATFSHCHCIVEKKWFGDGWVFKNLM